MTHNTTIRLVGRLTHLCIRVTEGGGLSDDEFAFDGCFDVLANSKAVTEDNKGNADLNFESFQLVV